MTITLKINGILEEIGTIPTRAVKGVGFVVDSGNSIFFIPTTIPDIQTIGKTGLLQRKIKITITLEEA